MELNALAETPAARVRAVDPTPSLLRGPGRIRASLGLFDRYFDRVLGSAPLRVADAATCEDVTNQPAARVQSDLRGAGPEVQLSPAPWICARGRVCAPPPARRDPLCALAL